MYQGILFSARCGSVVSNEQATDGRTIMAAELSTLVDLFLMSYAIMEAIISMRR